MSSLLLCMYILNIHFLQSLQNLIIIIIIKISTYLLFIFLVLNAAFNPVWHVKAVQDYISIKTVPIWMHHTVSGFIYYAIYPGNRLIVYPGMYIVYPLNLYFIHGLLHSFYAPFLGKPQKVIFLVDSPVRGGGVVH